MNRRTLLSAALIAPLAAPLIAAPPPVRAQTPGRPPSRTDWRVALSEGQDAIAFWGPLSGRDLYTRYYAADLEAFGPGLSEDIRSAVPALWAAAETDGVGLLSPNLALILSHADSDSKLDDVIAALGDPEARIGPAFRAGTYWNESDWGWFTARAPDLRRVFEAMRTAGFAAFRQERGGAALESGLQRLRSSLPSFDIIRVAASIPGSTLPCCSSPNRTASRSGGSVSCRPPTTTWPTRSGSPPTSFCIRPCRWTGRRRWRRSPCWSGIP